jgi:predicted enzyme related to lactoylglutathione lyase
MPILRRFVRVLLLAIGLVAGAAGAVAAERYWPPISDPPTGSYHTGRFVWAELLTRDVGTAAEFYGRVFGWTFETYGPADDFKTYTLVLSGGTPIGGMVYASPRKDAQDRRAAHWVGLISVPDVKAAAGYVRKAGGKVLMPPKVLGQRGTAALFLDPEGGLFGAVHSATGDPGDFLADDNTWLWVELWADDAPKMAAFYKGLAGYETVEGVARAESGGIVLRSGGYARAGILPKPAKVPTTWVPYIRVASVSDTVARASAAGARVAMQPVQMHGTTMAILVDPTGAPFAVAEWTAGPREAER